MLHKIKYLQCVIIKENKKKKKTKAKKKQQQQKKRSKSLIAVLEELVKISGIIFESHQRGSSV